MKYISSILIFFLSINFSFSQNYFSIGNWQDHLPYSKIKELAVIGDKFYAATPYSLVEVNNETNEITKYSTVNGLSETGISSIVANESQNTLVVAYESSNIDLIKDDQVINFSAILNSNIVGDKSIYEMVCKDRYVYVCTGFGIVVIDLNRVEVKDTYIIGSGNSQLKVNDIHLSNDSIFALTDLGVKCAPLTGLFLSDANSWTTIYNPTNLSFNHLESFNHDFLAYGDNNIVVQYKSGLWDTIINNPSEELNTIRVIDESIITCTRYYVNVYDLNMDSVLTIFAYSGENGITPNDVYKRGDFYWIADDKKGLRKVINSWNSATIIDNGPYTNEAFHLAFENNTLYVSAGRTYGTNWNKSFNWRGVYQMKESSWEMFNQLTIPIMAEEIDTISDIIWVSPQNENKFYASSFGGGLLCFDNGQLSQRYSYYNSSLQTRIGSNSTSVFVASTDFDEQGNLWVSNSFTDSPLSVMTSDGEWKSFYCGNQASNNLCTDLLVDDELGYIWMILKGTGILVYDFNKTPLDDSDDQYKIIGTGEGAGSLPSSFVNCLEIDYDGEVWIGTDKGPAVFYNPSSIFNETTFDAQKILIDTAGILQYLLENEAITDILVDGANKKWIATYGGGLFLMSEDATQTVLSFSSTNSPLFSDNITSLAINNESGELFIGTDKGVLGYRSTATSPAFNFQELEVFPNPVKPDYNGVIAVKGMMNNSEVKITNSNGILIKTVFSNGGQAIWDGRNSFNEPVNSGVYYFFATSEDGNSKAKSKVLIIR